MTLALMGAGLLGRAIAGRLQSVGPTVTVYNRTTTKALSLQARGIPWSRDLSKRWPKPTV